MQTNSPVSKSETWAFRNHFCIKEKTSLCLESINLHFWVYYRLWSQVKCINPLYAMHSLNSSPDFQGLMSVDKIKAWISDQMYNVFTQQVSVFYCSYYQLQLSQWPAAPPNEKVHVFSNQTSAPIEIIFIITPDNKGRTRRREQSVVYIMAEYYFACFYRSVVWI